MATPRSPHKSRSKSPNKSPSTSRCTSRNKSQAAALPPIPADLLVLTEEQAARLVGLSKFTLHRMRTNPQLHGAGPRHLQLSARRIGYRRQALEDWLRAQELGS